jgi:Uma2 family endonuclease
LAGFLASVLRIYVENQGLGQVRSAPFQMKTGPDLPGRQPDVLFIANEHLNRLRETYLDGPADLVIEIVSPESAARDRGAKFYEYASGGIPEYWLIDPQSRIAEFYDLEGDHYRTVLSSRQGKFQSQVVPGLWWHVEWLWQTPLPAVEEVLLEIGGEAYARRLIDRLRSKGFLPG